VYPQEQSYATNDLKKALTLSALSDMVDNSRLKILPVEDRRWRFRV
jgi:hypothetical protein